MDQRTMTSDDDARLRSVGDEIVAVIDDAGLDSAEAVAILLCVCSCALHSLAEDADLPLDVVLRDAQEDLATYALIPAQLAAENGRVTGLSQ